MDLMGLDPDDLDESYELILPCSDESRDIIQQYYNLRDEHEFYIFTAPGSGLGTL